MKIIFSIIFSLIFYQTSSLAQTVVVRGKVTDAETGDGMPLVNVVIKSSGKGTTTDFDGFYSLKLTAPVDSLIAFYVGYSEKTKPLKGWISQTVDFQLTPESSMLDEVTVILKENPAFPIMRQIIAHKQENDKKSLEAYNYESYTKNEISIDNISEKFRQKKVMKKIVQIFDSLKLIAGEDGKPLMPVFVSEALSDFYYRTNPIKTKELIHKSKVVGVGFDETSFVAQLVGSSFQEYNFYNNYINIVNKQFISPITDGWHGLYHYLLVDSAWFKGNWCYKIDFRPKQPQDLAFTGNMWIADSSFAIKQMDVTVGKSANLNYIEKIKIQQELVKTEYKAWLPLKTRVLIDVAEISDNSPGLLAKFYTSNKNFEINKPKEVKFFDELIEVAEDAKLSDEKFWDQNRHDSLTQTEKNVLLVIDSIRNMPVVKSYVEIVNIAVNGYKKVGLVDIGPYLFLYSRNNVEGNRFRLGFRTNIDFSKRWILIGYLAYGTMDNRFKYNASVSRIIFRKPWTIIGYERKEDYEQVGVPTEYIDNNLFLAAVQWGKLRGPYFTRQNIFSFQTTFRKDFTQKVTFKTKTFEPYHNYNFTYFENVVNLDTVFVQRYNTSEVTLETRYAKDELFVQRDLDRISLGTKKWPVFTFRYTMGIKGLFNSNYNYQKLFLGISHVLRLGIVGRLAYDLNGGKVFSRVPYPLLEVHMANQSPYYTFRAYNLMNYLEFVSDSYISLRLRHYFEGLFFNRIPLVKKLKWRLLATGNIVYGQVSKENHEHIHIRNTEKNVPRFYTLERKPYVEVGYGIENIFKILRIDFFHRLTYLENVKAKPFGIKFSIQFTL